MKKIFLFITYIHLVYATSFAQTISSGYMHSLFLCDDSIPKVCGWNQYGELGDGTDTTRYFPVPLSGFTKITAVVGGYINSYFLKNNGTVWTCGDNGNGQLGDGTTISKNVPVQVIGLTGIIAMAGGTYFSLFLKNDSTVWTCGDNSFGQFGDSTTTKSSIPIKNSRLSGIIAIAAGSDHSIFIKSDGTAWACGANTNGQLGDGTDTTRHIPVLVNGLTGIVAATADFNGGQSLFLKNDGTVWACGNNAAGQLGDGTTINRKTPVQVIGITDIVSVGCGEDHSAFLKNDGTVWGCGVNYLGQLGIGTMDHDSHSTPTQVVSLTGITAIAVGGAHSLFLRNDGTVWACGQGGFGALGDGSNTPMPTPIQVMGLCNISPTVGENMEKKNISIFPNPFSSQTTLQTGKVLKDATVTVYNLHGQSVKQIKNISGQSIIFYRENLPSGLYFLCLIQENKISARAKLVIINN